MKTYWGKGIMAPPFIILVLYGGEWSAAHPYRFTPEETAPATHCIGGWVNSRAGLGSMEKKNLLPLWEIEP
jgi:hypothetical protein